MANIKEILTAEYVRSILDYNPETGELRWKKTLAYRAPAGNFAGQYDYRNSLYIGIGNKRYRASRLIWLIMTGEWPKKKIDHQDVDSTNNCWLNLREATNGQNNHNKKIRKDNKIGFKGVTLHKSSGLYFSRISYNKKQYHLGYFKTPDAAHAAYAQKAIELYGEFARAA